VERTLIDAAVPLLARLLALSRFRPLGQVVRASLRLIDHFDLEDWQPISESEALDEEDLTDTI